MAATTRRQRLRREVLRDIERVTLDHLAQHGAAELSLRAVARDVGMSPAGLYRYVDGRDGLLTQLIVSGYDDLADHLLVAVGAPAEELSDPKAPPPTPAYATPADAGVGERLVALATAHRDWALAHPHQFDLLFGDPVPGYAAPPDGVTTAANQRVGRALGEPLVEAATAGTLRPLAGSEDVAAADVAGLGAVLPGPLPPWVPATMQMAWGRLHGMVALELNGQFDYLGRNGAAALARATATGLVADLGLDEVRRSGQVARPASSPR
jgi:AcrR family transcriptional regulator